MPLSPAAVTAQGIRDGERAALTALVGRRGSAVIAYCDHMAAPGRALEAAGEAFAGFRREVRDAEDPRALDPEAVLLSSTRRAAAALAPKPEPPAGLFGRRRALTCQFIPELLAARADGELSAADRLRLSRHLERCEDCREAEERFAAAERAYVEAPSSPPEAGVAGGLLAALRAAAPNADERVAAPAGVSEPVTAPAEGNGASATPAADGDEAGSATTLSWDPADVLAEAAPAGHDWRRVAVRVVIPGAVAIVAALTALLVAGAFGGGDGKGPAGSIETQGVLPPATLRVLQRPTTTPLPPASAPRRRHASAPAVSPPAQPASAAAGTQTVVPAVRPVNASHPAPAATTREHAASLDGGAEAAPPVTGGSPAGDEPGFTPTP